MADPHGNAFYIFDKIAYDAYYYLKNNVGWTNSYGLYVKWLNGYSVDGTHYHPGGSIDLVSGDGWDEDVFLHEYSHFVMYKIYGNTFPDAPNCNPACMGSALQFRVCV